MKDHTLTEANRFPDGGWPFLGASNAAGLPEAGGDVLHFWMAVSSEMVGFGNERYRKLMQAAGGAMQMANLNDAIALQARYAQDLVRDYAEETSRVIGLWATAVTHRGGDEHTPLDR